MPRTLGDTAVVSASYNQGNFSIEAIAETQVYAQTTTITAATSTHSGNYEFLGTSYDFHFVKLGALAVLHRGAGNITASNFAGYTDPNNVYYDVSALFPHVLASNGSVMVSFGQYRLQRSSHGNSSSWGVRYDYHLSPRTGVYAGVAGILNGSEASFTQTGAQQTGIPVSPGKNELALLVGMMHRF
jgi:predicted porin